MDQHRFDTLTRTISTVRSRRAALGTLLAGTLGLLDLAETSAKKACSTCKKRKHGKCKANKQLNDKPCPDGSDGTCQERGVRQVVIGGNATRTVADLSGGGMLAKQPLRIRLRLPRYWRRHQTLPGAGNLFGRWRLRVGQLWIRLHLRQSRGAPVRLRLDGGVSRREVHRKQRLRIRLPLHQSRNQCRPVCLARTIGVAARAPVSPGECSPGDTFVCG